MVPVPFTKSFSVTGAVRTLLYERSENSELRNSDPQWLVIVSRNGAAVTVVVEWERFAYEGTTTTFHIADGHEVSGGGSDSADLTKMQFRSGDKLYLTPSVDCDAHLQLQEPGDRR